MAFVEDRQRRLFWTLCLHHEYGYCAGLCRFSYIGKYIRALSIAFSPEGLGSRIGNGEEGRGGRWLPDRRRPARSASAAADGFRARVSHGARLRCFRRHCCRPLFTYRRKLAYADILGGRSERLSVRQNMYSTLYRAVQRAKQQLVAESKSYGGSEIDRGRFADVRWEVNKKYAIQIRTWKRTMLVVFIKWTLFLNFIFYDICFL